MASISEILDKIIAKYQPGGGFGKSELALLKRGKTKAMAGVGQQLVRSGLAGTTAGAGASQRWEEEIGMPARLELEDIRTQRLVQALLAKAGFQERAQEAEAERRFEAREAERARAGAERQATLARPSPWDPGFLGGGFQIGGAIARQLQQPGIGTHTGAGADFTIPTGQIGQVDQGGGTWSDPTLGQEVYGPDAGRFGGVATRGGIVGAERTPITSGAPRMDFSEFMKSQGVASFVTGSPEEERLYSAWRTYLSGR